MNPPHKAPGFRAKVINIGGDSIGIIVPKKVADYIGIKEHDYIDFQIKKVSPVEA